MTVLYALGVGAIVILVLGLVGSLILTIFSILAYVRVWCEVHTALLSEDYKSKNEAD